MLMNDITSIRNSNILLSLNEKNINIYIYIYLKNNVFTNNIFKKG